MPQPSQPSLSITVTVTYAVHAKTSYILSCHYCYQSTEQPSLWMSQLGDQVLASTCS
jgi:hypothetical protein